MPPLPSGTGASVDDRAGTGAAASPSLCRPTEAMIAELRSLAQGHVHTDVDLAALTRWRIGGPADCCVSPGTIDACRAVVERCRDLGLRFMVIGDSSNLLFDDRGYRGVLVRIGPALGRVTIRGTAVTVQAGAWVPAVARRVGSAGLTGIEHIVGIPGTFGGLVAMNGGSLRQGIGDSIVEVTALVPDATLQRFEAGACGFAYRRSRFQESGHIVVEATLALAPGDVGTIRRRMIEIMASRRRRFPLKLPNCGSVFVSDPAMYQHIGPPGAAIERCGLKGTRIGNAQIAQAHANFIVNLGGARSSDVLALVDLARQRVLAATGFAMDCEVRHVAPDGRVRPAHMVPRHDW
jgi:UDP-N-acetylmuramate dehydrogenase